jgi:Domain of unknown function (DUF1839)
VDTNSTESIRPWGFDPASYVPHSLHRAGLTYLETNCYADVLIELLHVRGYEPRAALGSLVRTDWEGDQFTYAKPRYADLERLFGIDVHEMLPYLPLPDHIAEQLSLGRTVLVEIDAWYLPDTEGISYRCGHLKTTVAPDIIDRPGERLRYFHNAGLFELSGEDYRGAFRMLEHFTDDVMDPFTEIVIFDAGPRLEGDELRTAARDLLAYHFDRRPASNPFAAWARCLESDLPRLLAGSADDYHEYAFVTVRMAGSAFQLLADHVAWTLGEPAAEAAAEFRAIADATKVVSFRLARQRPFKISTVLAPLLHGWERGMGLLGQTLGR